MQRILLGEQQGLVFPIKCNASIKINYADNIPDMGNYGYEGTPDSSTSTDIPFGIWGHKGSFTLDANNLLDKSGTPWTWRSTIQNSPAKYKLEVQITTGSVTTTLTSDAVILPSVAQPALNNAELVDGGINRRGQYVKDKVETLGIGADNRDGTFTVVSNSLYFLGQELFTRSGFDYTSLGTVSTISGTTITLTATPSTSISSLPIFQHAPYEIPYVNNTYHVGMSYDGVTQKMALYFNNRIVKSGIHGDTNAFQLVAEDLFIGANGTNQHYSSAGSVYSIAGNNNQFMGVLHELSYIKGVQPTISAHNLNPPYNRTLLYLTFEEVDA